MCLEPMLCNKRSHHNKKPVHHNEDPVQPKTKINKLFFKINYFKKQQGSRL